MPSPHLKTIKYGARGASRKNEVEEGKRGKRKLVSFFKVFFSFCGWGWRRQPIDGGMYRGSGGVWLSAAA
jgi:hypothetical protein